MLRTRFVRQQRVAGALVIALMCLPAVCLLNPPTLCGAAIASDPLRVEVANLREQLENGLKARQPAEFAFIGRVVEMVEAGQLPLEVVNSTFLWARKKRPYPFVYFERALRVRAARLGIEIN